MAPEGETGRQASCRGRPGRGDLPTSVPVSENISPKGSAATWTQLRPNSGTCREPQGRDGRAVSLPCGWRALCRSLGPLARCPLQVGSQCHQLPSEMHRHRLHFPVSRRNPDIHTHEQLRWPLRDGSRDALNAAGTVLGRGQVRVGVY